MDTQKKRKILVTAALIYANGDVHIGHLVEYIQTDIFVRFQKLRGNDCLYICANDTHGTPIMISARNQKITPEELIAEYYERHQKDFSDFHIEFDNFYTTNSPENKEYAEYFYKKMQEKNCIVEKEIKQLYCEHDNMFLPDRFVTGTCPKCKAEEQYGDSCDVCSATYNPIDMKDCSCVMCGNLPKEKTTNHFFFKLTEFEDFLKEWTGPEHMRVEVKNKLNEWFDQGLKDWDITRDAPYFGFKIPGTEDKYFYVWHDAPIGYIAATKNWADKNNTTIEELWQNEEAELYHFLGKDILYFHTLFWPAMLEAADMKQPNYIFIHGMLKIDNKKMSKSKGTFINASTYMKHLDPQYLRYYYASKLSSGIEDINLSLDDFRLKINSDLVGKLANIGSRVAGMLTKKLEGRMGKLPEDGIKLVQILKDSADNVAKYYEATDYNRVIKEVIDLASHVNKYAEETEPWKVIGDNPERGREIITTILNCFKIITIYLKPVLPKFAADVEEFMKLDSLTWNDIDIDIEEHEIGKFKHLVKRVEEEKIEKMIEESKVESEKIAKPAKKDNFEPIEEECTIEDFVKVDMRAAKIISADHVEGANKLLAIKLDLGFTTKNVFAGIKKSYNPEDLIGKMVVCVANLKPRKMKFGMSEGMICCASDKDGLTKIISPDEGAYPGMRIH